MNTRVLSIVFVALTAVVCLGQDDSIGLIYDANTGDLEFLSTVGQVTTFELKSASEILVADSNPDVFNGLFDVNTSAKAFKLDPDGFSGLHLPGLLSPGLSCAELLADLTLDGSFAAGGPIGNLEAALLCVPEPPSSSLCVFAAVALLACRRVKR